MKIEQIIIFLVLLIANIGFASALTTPYSLSGHVYSEGTSTPIVGANITFTNQATSEVLYTTSTANGEYQQDAANFPSGYSNGDIIQYYTVYQYNTNTTTKAIDTSGGGTLLDIYINVSYAMTNITVKVGSTWISWGWAYNKSVDVWIDGKFVTASTLNEYTLTDLNAREQHSIALFDTGNVIGTNTVMTYYPQIIFYFLLIVAFILLAISFFTREYIIAIILDTFGFFIAISAFYLTYPLYFTIFSYICLAIAIMCMLWILCIVFVLIVDYLKKYEEGDEGI